MPAPDSDQSFVLASTILHEQTPKAIGLALLLLALFAGANAHLGLKVGLTVPASTPASVICTLPALITYALFGWRLYRVARA